MRSIKATDLKALYVHVKPPSLDVLAERLRARQTDSDESVKKRLEVAKQELEYGMLVVQHIQSILFMGELLVILCSSRKANCPKLCDELVMHARHQ